MLKTIKINKLVKNAKVYIVDQNRTGWKTNEHEGGEKCSLNKSWGTSKMGSCNE